MQILHVMRIAMVSTCAAAVPPKGYGGTELVAAELATMLTRLGHDVVVFATGDSTPAGKLLWRFPKPVWPPNEHAELRHAAFAWRAIVQMNAQVDGEIDVVHVHQAPSLAMAGMQHVPVVATLHHERDARLLEFYGDFPEVTYVGISRRQAELSSELGIRHVVHHGLDPDKYPRGDGRGGYFAFLGRLAPEKGVHLAIDAAVAAGVPLRIGGNAHACAADYFEREVKPRLANKLVTHLGEVSHGPKVELLRHARALLFPVEWEEPFGLVMIEAMLTGTPVIAFPRGAAPEVIDEGVTGFLVRSVAELAQRMRHIATFDRARCRARAIERWSSIRMARDYVRVYESAIAARAQRRTRLVSGTDVVGVRRGQRTGTE